MLSLEQVKLLETKVANAIDYIQLLTGENAALRTKLEANQKRIDELEVFVTRFKEEQSRIEDGILSALDRLNQFEDAVEKSLAVRNKEARPEAAQSAPEKEAKTAVDKPDKPSAAPPPDTPPAHNAADSAQADIDPLPENGELDIF